MLLAGLRDASLHEEAFIKQVSSFITYFRYQFSCGISLGIT